MQTVRIVLSPEEAADAVAQRRALDLEAGRSTAAGPVRLVQQAIDARSRKGVRILQTWQVYDPDEEVPVERPFSYQDVHAAEPVLVVGSGPAGLFAALRLIERGLRPIVVERGKPVGERKKDIALLSRGQGLNPESNYCFGEGGAGTFSDGKLYTRSNKRGDISRILARFRYHGADASIGYESHPHIGSDKLPDIVRSMTRTIRDCGGSVLYATRVASLWLEGDTVRGVKTDAYGDIAARCVVWAAGQSASDMYETLYRQGVRLECIPFAMGVRVEHPQDLIDEIQYHGDPQQAFLPAASYALTAQVAGRGVHSFCMCPGGYMVASSSDESGQVVNGMSSSRRHTPFANSGIVVEVRPEDLAAFASDGPLAGLHYRQSLERLALLNGGGRQTAPAQRIDDFVHHRLSSSLPLSSYVPGLIVSPLHFWLPETLTACLTEGFRLFDRKMHGFLTHEALLTGMESRSSSPVRLPRDPVTLEHVQLHGLFPCGEGSGYAGGITSSAMDGEAVANRIADRMAGIF